MKGLTALIDWELKTVGLHTIKFPLMYVPSCLIFTCYLSTHRKITFAQDFGRLSWLAIGCNVKFAYKLKFDSFSTAPLFTCRSNNLFSF
jgi:hypothetical protein